jgi:low temperature requirement protein LtrA
MGVEEEDYRVTTLELFFDLVFAFTITQLTSVLLHELTPLGLLRVIMPFGVLYWMYGGYAWLTNTMSPTGTTRRLLLLVGMAGFLIVALATPRAFQGSEGVWGLGFLLVVLVHAGLYQQCNRSIFRVLPFNLASASLIIIAGLVSGSWVYVLWAIALLMPIVSPRVVQPRTHFSLRAPHIVERHGALVIITLGESVVAIGIGLSGLRLTFGLILTAVLGLALAASLWWCYFTGDDERAEKALSSAGEDHRVRLILNAYFYAHIPILLGIVVLATGVKKAIGHPAHALPAGPAIALAGGVALFLAGSVAFRTVLRIGPSRTRALAALLCAATIPIGIWGVAEAELVALVAVVVLALVVEGAGSRRDQSHHLGQSGM